MKKLYLLLLFILFSVSNVLGQTTEYFESATAGSASFTSNGQTFNITSAAQGPFEIYSDVAAYGWNGTAADYQFIDNSGSSALNVPVEFTVASAGGVNFTLKSMYLYLANSNTTLPPTNGDCTITGKLGGATVFTATSNSGFTTSLATNNGYTFINMTNFGGANNASTNIDSFTIKTTGAIAYVALDAMTWQSAGAVVLPTVTTTTATNVGAVKATMGGNVTNGGGGSITDRGIVWSFAANPTTTTNNGSLAMGTGTGSFSGLVSGLLPNTQIHYRAYATNSAGTSYGADMTVTPNPELAISISQTDVTCNGGTNGTITATVTGGKPGYTYAWSPAGGSAATASGLSAGTYSVIVQDTEGTFKSATGIIISQPAATPTAITGNPPNRTICEGNNTTFPSTASNATAYQWQVNTGSGFTNITNGGVYSGATTATLTVTGATPAMSGYLFRVVASNLCSSSATSNQATLTVPNMTVSTTAQTNVICNGGNTGAATISVSGGIAPYTYSWSPSGGSTASPSGLTAGTYTVTVTDNIACQKTHTVTITEPTAAASLPQISAQPASASVCENGTTAFSVAATNISTYQWQVNSGSGFTNITDGGTAPNYSGATTNTLTVSAVTPGMNTYLYRALLTNSCATIQTNGLAQLTVNSYPVATATPSSTAICSGTSPNIALTSSPTGATFAWTASLTSGTVTGFSASSGTTINQSLTGNGVVTYTVTPTLNGCPGTPINVVVTVNPTPVATATPSSESICTGSSTAIALTSTPTGASFAWTAALISGAVSGFSDGSGTSIAQNLTGNGVVAYTVTPTLNGCPGTPIVVNVTVKPLPTATATPASETICSGNATNIALTSTPTGASFDWTAALTSGTVTGYSASSGTTIAQTLTGNGIVTYTITPTLNGCPGDPITVAITVNGATTITGQPSNTLICAGGSTTFSATASLATSYQWQEDSGSGFNNITNNTTYADAQTATLTISNATAAMNGYAYRLLATGICTTATSSSVALTVTTVTATPFKTDVSCNGESNGSASVTPSGGTAPYTYLWSNGETADNISGLPEGNYSVTITDANFCENIQNITITEPSLLVASQGTTINVSCHNGSNGYATVSATGGTPPYTYSWSPTGGTAATASGLTEGIYTATVTDANSCTATQSFTITEPDALTATASNTNVSCNGGTNGTATAIPTGGTGTYTYAWSPSGGTAATATGLSAGTYTVTVTDANGCTETASTTITEPALLTATILKTDISCNGANDGTATVTGTGGTGAYTYSWAPSGGTAATATGLSAGNYTVTITDANGCTATDSVIITEPTAITTTTSQTNLSCDGGSNGVASVSATGGTGGYTYSWSPSGGTAATATGLTAGTYTVTITDANSCTATASIILTEPSAFIATTSKTDVSCNSGSNGLASVIATGGTGAYTYSWSPTGGTAATATGLTAGTYTVTVTDANGCTATQTATINEPAVLTATTTQTNVLCNGTSSGTATVTAIGGTGTYTYSWAPSGGTAATATGLAAGTYTATVTDNNGCTATTSVTITEPSFLVASTSLINN
ncbi:hypothetical protein GON26_21340, partial [Flavobacterium sp. GA093]